MIRPLDREALREQYRTSKPYPFVVIENFLEPASAKEVGASYPDFEDARTQGREFDAVNEKRKVQICDVAKFPPPVLRLHEAMSSPAFLEDLAYISGLSGLMADERYLGAGMHVTGSGGRLDVHVDFNFDSERKIHRRLNLLLYLNPEWKEAWGGHIEIWNKDVTKCEHSFVPRLNRCLIFETSRTSFHGVQPVTGPMSRRSFAAYFYTHEAPPNWTGEAHSTIFQARPDEKIRGALLMPAEALGRGLRATLQRSKDRIKALIRR